MRSFVFNKAIVDHLDPFPDADYSKPIGYETVRYPLSGLVGPADKAATEAHNAKFADYSLNVKLLNLNIVSWLTTGITVQGTFHPYNVGREYRNCLDAPNYTVFSNTTSATEWNDHTDTPAVPLESPHNHIHLAVGGYEVPGQGDFSPIDGANGDMGENDTAGLDPIFFFHHCHVDRMFWLWQKRHGCTGSLEIMEGYPGTNSVDSQGPTPGVAPNSWLNVDSPLAPFRHPDGRPVVSRDLVDIEQQLGYTYGPGSLDDLAAPALAAEAPQPPAGVISIRGVNRAAIRGSFLLSAFGTVDGTRQHLGTEAILSRWHVEGCMNCQTHLEARGHIRLHDEVAAALDPDSVEVEVRTRGREHPGASVAGGPGVPAARFTVRLR
ncbi:MAG TPA: tyrosinase family protein [Acidimicrobiales bacterium]|nr:tyrosinase family protein [Acidimicrobiales bacterium]